jgi:hypothetical protein
LCKESWKIHFSQDEYSDQLIGYDRILQEDEFVPGATIFALESQISFDSPVDR